MSGREFQGRRALVVGLGRSGCAAADLLLSLGASVRAVDRDEAARSRAAVSSLESRGVSVMLGPHSPEQLGDADLVVVSPGVDPRSEPVASARDRGVEVMGELEMAARVASVPLAAVTGSNGKSTVTSLAGAMLAASGRRVGVGGNLGEPLSALLQAETDAEAHVLEVSSFQAESLERARFAVVAVLNISDDHLDRHGSIEAYAEAKLSLLDRQDERGVAILSDADERVAAGAARARGEVTWFGSEARRRPAIVARGERAVACGDEERELFPLDGAWPVARHDVDNALAAAGVALALGATSDGLRSAVEAFRGLPHRMQPVPTATGPRFLDDSKATNVAAAVAAIRGAGAGVVAILGGRHKGGDLAPLAEALAAVSGRAVLIGEAAPALASALGDRVPHERAESLAEAVRIGADRAGETGTVLLAPACSSFDAFADYTERGRCFAAAAHALCGAAETRGGSAAGGGSSAGCAA